MYQVISIGGPFSSVRRHSLAFLGLFVSASIILGIRICTFSEPLDRDWATYCLIGDELLKGRRLYSDIWDHKPPAVYWTCAIAEFLVGYGKPTAFALGIATAFATLAAVYRCGVLLGGKTAGICASLFWAVASGDLNLQANQPNVEAFLNALISWAFVILIGLDPQAGGVRRSLMAGILIGVSSVYKPVSVFIAVPLALAGPACFPGRPRAWSQLLLMALPSLIIWAGLSVGFSLNDHFNIFWDTIVRYNAYYAGDIAANLASSLEGPRLVDLISRQILYPLAILTIPALVCSLRGRYRMLFAAWILGTHIAVASPGMSFPHYFQLWLPPLAVGAGCGAVAFLRLTTGSIRILASLVIAFNIAWVCEVELSNARLSPNEWSRRKYGDVFVEAEALGRRLDGLLRTDETFYQWGEEGELYTSSRRRPPTGVFWGKPLLSGPLASELTAKTLAELERSRPEIVIVYHWYERKDPYHPVLQWIRNHYRPYFSLPDVSESDVFVCIEGRLDRISRQ